MMRVWRRPIGPAKPIGAPVRAATVSASARLRSVRPKSFLTLVSFTSWSPRTNTATVSEGVLYSSVLTRRWGVVFKHAVTSSTVRAPGVGTFRSGRVVSVEAVGVLHDELASPHEAEARTNFIPELGLDLITIQRELPIGTDVPTNQVRDHFLMRRTETEVALMTILDPEQLLPVKIPTT